MSILLPPPPLLLAFGLFFSLSTAVGSHGDHPGRLVRTASGYSVHEAPASPNGTRPIVVEFSVNLRNVLDVNEKEQLISLETSLRMFWRDPRIVLTDDALRKAGDDGYVTLNPSVAHHFWIPDVFLDRAKALRDPTYFTRPASLRIYNDSMLRYSSRVNYDVACPMDFHSFPVDKQVCEINFESFGHSSKQLLFRWKTDGSNNVNPNITLAQFLMDVSLSDSYATDYYDLSYPGVIMRIKLTRQIGYHVVQTYIPSVVFVVLGWLSLFISPESVPGRVGMGMTTLLTLTAMFGGVRQNVPRVSYVSYLDVWMVTCIFFVFICILEFTVVSSLIRSNLRATADRAEAVSRVAIPAAFAVFNLIYWPSLYMAS